MGGGGSKNSEVAKRLRRRAGHGEGGAARGAERASSSAAELETPICERGATVSFRVKTTVAAGTAVRVVRGDPPALVADGRTVGVVSDRRQAATLAACLDDGYAIVGEIVAIDSDIQEGLASVVGVRSG